MTSAQKALNNKKLLKGFFQKGNKAVGSGRYVLENGKSKSGPCKLCRSKVGVHNIRSANGKTPPYHPNCKCHLK